jgi:hypothetical protein
MVKILLFILLLPLALLGSLLLTSLVGFVVIFLIYLGCCIHDHQWPSIRGFFDQITSKVEEGNNNHGDNCAACCKKKLKMDQTAKGESQ